LGMMLVVSFCHHISPLSMFFFPPTSIIYSVTPTRVTPTFTFIAEKRFYATEKASNDMMMDITN